MIEYEHEAVERDRPVNCCQCRKRLADCVKIQYEEVLTEDGIETRMITGTHPTAYFCTNPLCWRSVRLDFTSTWRRKK